MKKSLIIAGLALGALFYSSCDGETLLPSDDGSSNIAEGLKKALEVGTDTAVSRLNVTDGYFKGVVKGKILKILLPDQVENSINAFRAKSITVAGQTLTGAKIYDDGFPLLGIEPLSSKEDDIILGINRAAENAASDAKPIFIDAITGLTISDALGILEGTDSAATTLLREKTELSLISKFDPKIDESLSVVKVGDKSVVESYENFISTYNNIINTNIPGTGLIGDPETVGSRMNINAITVTDLSEHATQKAMNGLFSRVQAQEEQIRQDPLARVTDLLKDVFGKLD